MQAVDFRLLDFRLNVLYFNVSGSNLLKSGFRKYQVIDEQIAELGAAFEHVKTYV